MKKSKLFPLVLALILALITVLSLTASAAGASIVISYPEGHDLGGQVFKAYKILDVTTDGTHYAYTLDPHFAGFRDYPNFNSQTLLEYLGSGAKELSFNSPEMTAIATNLWTYVEATSISPDQTADGVSWKQDVTFLNLEPGYYLVFSLSTVPGQDNTGREGDVTVVAACALVTATDRAEVVITPKVDVPTIEAKILNHSFTGSMNGMSEELSIEPASEPLDPSSHRWRNWTDVSIGDSMQFRLRSSVPEMIGYESYIFTVHNKLSAGLSYVPGSVEVRVGDRTLAVNVHYAVDTTGNLGGDTFRVRIYPEEFIKFTPGEVIEILYSAELNEQAVIGAPGNPNTIYLEYGNNPYAPLSTGRTRDFTTIAYTFKLGIFKFYDDNQPLAKAEFALKKNGAPINLILVNEAALNADPNVYRVARPSESASAITAAVTPRSGLITILGLDADTYTLEETKAPDGFNKLTTEKTIVITHTDKQGSYSMTVDGVSSNLVKVENHGGPVLPSTGGVGTAIFYALSAVLTILLAAFFISRRRKNILKA